MEPIQLFVPTFRNEECLAEIRECLEKGWTGLGFKTVEFEDAWKNYTGLPHAHFLNSATAGLHLAVRMLKEDGNWQPGDEIISTPLTFVSTNHAILYEELQPIFADVDETLCLDPVSVAERITSRTRAVMYVGIGGNTGHLDAIVALCRARIPNCSTARATGSPARVRFSGAGIGDRRPSLSAKSLSLARKRARQFIAAQCSTRSDCLTKISF